ncbi:MAG: DUF2804 domain-containing protein [Deltaproteobacteria bacterium]|nr:DUF2804 domain-containing protein [Deltaproteobacteria bacterium]
MRKLLLPPPRVIDPDRRVPALGSFRGPLPPVDLSPLGRGRLFRLARHKRWTWLGIAADEVFVGLAVVDLTYAASTFAFAVDRATGRLLSDQSALGPGFVGSVNEHAEEGAEARFALGARRASVLRPRGTAAWAVHAELGDLRLDAKLDSTGAPPPLSAIVEPVPGALATTQKRALLPVTGTLQAGGRTFDLGRAVAGIDYSNGYPPRHTVWNWCFLLGRARSGERVALNIVQGFVGEAECVAWVGDVLYPLGEGRFTYDLERPLAPWHVRTDDGAVTLEFAPQALHREDQRLGIISSRFAQVAGHFHGTFALPDRPSLELDGVPGVVEDQDMLW